jgi:hypothetical protein
MISYATSTSHLYFLQDLDYQKLMTQLEKVKIPWIMSNFFMKETQRPVCDTEEYRIIEHAGFKV